MHYLVEVTLESLFQTVLGLTYILFLASSAGYTVDQVIAVACHIVFRVDFSASNGCHNVAFLVQQMTILAPTVGACCNGPLGLCALLRDGGEL